VEKINYDATERSSKNLKVTLKSLTLSTSDSTPNTLQYHHVTIIGHICSMKNKIQTHKHTQINLCTVKWAHCDKTQSNADHLQVLIIFGRNITKKASNQKMLYFSTSPN